jgi:hypothetical protein
MTNEDVTVVLGTRPEGMTVEQEKEFLKLLYRVRSPKFSMPERIEALKKINDLTAPFGMNLKSPMNEHRVVEACHIFRMFPLDALEKFYGEKSE